MAEENAPASATEEFVTTRLFDAPRELVWQTFTEARHLQKWFGPKGFKVSVAKLELRRGGAFLYSMQTPDAGLQWNLGPAHRISGRTQGVVFSSYFPGSGAVPLLKQ
jgi:uncharacterized protein YndB with AHSA1/START domain